PTLWLPWMWVRPPDKVALLPPSLAWRADAGLVAGAGVHLPWQGRALDVTGAGYTRGGFEVGARLRTASSDQRVLWDEIVRAPSGAPSGTRVELVGSGDMPARSPTLAALAWHIDAVRGERGRAGTIDLGSAAKPFDAGAALVSVRTSREGGALLGAGV